MDQRFATRHQLDNRFWALIWLYIVLIVILGFREPVRDRFFDDVQEPAALALQIHVWSFGAWLVLLATQAGLAATKRLDWHRTLGLIMLPLAAIMVLSAGVSELRALNRAIAEGESGGFSAITGTYILPFVILVLLAWGARRNPPAHMRLILMATASICAGAHLRAISSFDNSLFWASDSHFVHLLIGFGGSMLIVTLGMIYDLATRHALTLSSSSGRPCCSPGTRSPPWHTAATPMPPSRAR